MSLYSPLVADPGPAASDPSRALWYSCYEAHQTTTETDHRVSAVKVNSLPPCRSLDVWKSLKKIYLRILASIFSVELHWHGCRWSWVNIGTCKGLGANTCANVGPVLCHHMASPGHSELILMAGTCFTCGLWAHNWNLVVSILALNVDFNDPIRSQFCTCHNSIAVADIVFTPSCQISVSTYAITGAAGIVDGSY